MGEIVFYWVWSWLRESMLEGLPYRLGMAGGATRQISRIPQSGMTTFKGFPQGIQGKAGRLG